MFSRCAFVAALLSVARGAFVTPLAADGALAPPPPPPPALYYGFDAGFGSNMVLQRAPAAAAIYGYLDTPAATVKVTVSSNGAPLYTVDATYNTTLQPFGDGWGARPCPKAECPPYDMDSFTPFSYPLPTWKVLLQPTAAGGNYTITAVCTGCVSNVTTLTMTNVIFGVRTSRQRNPCLAPPRTPAPLYSPRLLTFARPPIRHSGTGRLGVRRAIECDALGLSHLRAQRVRAQLLCGVSEHPHHGRSGHD